MEKKIFILSDQVIHWNIVPAANQKNIFMETWGIESTQNIFASIKAYFDHKKDPMGWSLVETDSSSRDLSTLTPCDNTWNHAFATWQQYREAKNKAWRIQELVQGGQALQPEFHWQSPAGLEKADLFIFQDWEVSIRHRLYPGLANLSAHKWVIFRTCAPLFEGELWQEFRQRMGSKDILILRADDLRKLNTSISKGLSWEQTLQDIINEIYFKRNISLYPLRSIEYIIISFGCAGTLLIHNPKLQDAADPEFSFFFDAMMVEGYWEKAHPGYLPGDLELLIALLSKEILYPKIGADIQLDRAIRAHLLARRALVTRGGSVPENSLAFEVLPAELDKVYGTKPASDFKPVRLDFDFFKSLFSSSHADRQSWSLLGMTKWDHYSLARQIALQGPMKALQGWNIPIAKYNFLLTVDRKEIEFLHHLKSLITEYLQNRSSQPLSIAVFGPPGSGKSFSIKQLAKALDLPDYEVKDITFNLSQFNEENPNDLYQAFHAVRDISLSGKTPLVFWDEFDSKALAWLRYFLAPMQDGEFQEGQLTHNIGKSIFVFAGGTCACMEEFEEQARLAKAQKGPDFLSRIKGFLNVMGPNPLIPYSVKDPGTLISPAAAHRSSPSENADPEYIIRRAILINSLLQLGYPQLFKDGVLQIDDGVLNAFLLVPRYKHGTRSLETIFKTSQLFGKTKYHRSDLPPESQLDLHVDGQQFFELVAQEPVNLDGGKAFYHLVNEITFDEQVVEKMAVGIHSMYSLVFSIQAGRDPLSVTRQEFLDQMSKMKDLPEGMPHDEVSQNYHNARKIPEKLAAVGLAIVPAGVNLPAAELDVARREAISRMEHIRWVRHHIDSGWSYAPKKDKPAKLHDALVPWDEQETQDIELVYGKKYTGRMGKGKGIILNEPYRDLDRVVTMAIPWILETVGYKIVLMNQDQ